MAGWRHGWDERKSLWARVQPKVQRLMGMKEPQRVQDIGATLKILSEDADSLAARIDALEEKLDAS